VAPLELDSTQAKALRAEIPEVVYESLKRTLRVRLPEEPRERFAAVLRTADALLAVKSELAQAA
jgi:hypothetical protein